MDCDTTDKVSRFLSWSIGASIKAVAASELAGGVHTNLLVDCVVAGRNERFVVRMMPPADCFGFARKQVVPYDLQNEHATLVELQGCDLPVPKVWRFDETGEMLGRPAYAMEFIPGDTVLQVALRGHNGIDRSFAEAISRMNRIKPRQLPQLIKRVGLPDRQPADLLGWLHTQVERIDIPMELRRALDFVDAEQPSNRPCPTFGNGDLNPTNFICRDDGSIAVVDWEYAGFADPIAEIMLLHTWPEDAPFLQSHPIDRIYCEMNGVSATLLKWYEVCSAISGWIYAANDDNRTRMKLHKDHLSRCLN